MKKILLLLLVTASVGGFAQKVSSKLSFQKGQKIEVTNNMNMTTQMMMGEITGSTVGTEVYDVKDASGSAATVEKSVKNMKINFSMMGQEKSFDSDNPNDLKGDLGEPLKKMLDARQEFTIDASGKITAVKEEDGKKKKEEASRDMTAAMMSQMNMGSAAPKVGGASFFKILPDYEVGKGDSWMDTSSVNGNAFKTNYTLKDITANEIILDFTGDGKINTTQEMMGMSMAVTGTIKSSGMVTLDKATGLLKQKTSTATTETSTSVSGQEIASTSKMTTVTTVKSM